MSITPYLPVAQMTKQFKPIAVELSRHLKTAVELVPVQSYAELIEHVAKGSVDIAILPPLSYVRALERVPKLKLVAQQLAWGEPEFSSFLVVRNSNSAKTMQDLRGRMTFVDQHSTSGFLLPYHAFISADIDPESHFEQVDFAGTHIDAVRRLVHEETDVIAVAAGMLEAATQSSPAIDIAGLRIFANVGRVPYDVVTVRPELGDVAAERIGRAFGKIDCRSMRGRELLKDTAGITGWIQADRSEYERIRKMHHAVHTYRSSAKEAPE
jgi:phosphate/phosphite/phosphonate ABC transporter binding protein